MQLKMFFKKNFLCLCVTQKNFHLPSFSFPSSFRCFWADWQKFFSKFSQLAVFVDTCEQVGSPSLDTPTNFCVYVLEFFLLEHGMPCALEINSNSRSQRRHVESCLSTTKSFHYPNAYGHRTLQKWRLTMRGSHS